MEKVKVGIAAAVALCVGAAGVSATAPSEPAPVKQARASAPLLPLTDRDITSGPGGAGCGCSFDQGNRTLLHAAGNQLMVRTRAGRQVCRMTDARFQQFAGGSGTFNCGGVRMSLRETGSRESSPETDSSGGPAALALTQGRSRRTINGEFGCAC